MYLHCCYTLANIVCQNLIQLDADCIIEFCNSVAGSGKLSQIWQICMPFAKHFTVYFVLSKMLNLLWDFFAI